MICEQASWSSLAWFGVSLFGHPDKLMQGLQLRKELAGIPFFANSWPLAAHGGQSLENLTVSRGGKAETVPCDYLACGFHLVPNIELPLLLGCQIKAGCVGVNDFQETTVSRVFCAGEPTGIGGVELSIARGRSPVSLLLGARRKRSTCSASACERGALRICWNGHFGCARNSPACRRRRLLFAGARTFRIPGFSRIGPGV